MSLGSSSIARRPTWRRASPYKTHARSVHFLPHALVVTLSVLAIPACLVWWLRESGRMTSLLALIAVGVLASLSLTWGAGAAWARRSKPEDLLFSELLLWGWFRRWRSERRLASGEVMLRRVLREDDCLPVARRASVLVQVSAAFEAQDTYLDGHSRRVARHAALVAEHMGLGREEVERIRAAAAVHDVGKLRIPHEVLDKPAALTDAEFELVKRHPDEGAAIVSCLEDTEITRIVRHHHERLDGKGYPQGLAGGDIPLGARIVAVADTFDAITSPRPYRPAASHRRAIETMRAAAGTQLDREAVEVFIRCYAGRRAVIVWAALVSGLQRILGAPGPASAATAAADPGRLIPLTTTFLTAGAATGLVALLPAMPSTLTLPAHRLALTASTIPAPAHLAGARPAPSHARLARRGPATAAAHRHRVGASPSSHGRTATHPAGGAVRSAHTGNPSASHAGGATLAVGPVVSTRPAHAQRPNASGPNASGPGSSGAARPGTATGSGSTSSSSSPSTRSSSSTSAPPTATPPSSSTSSTTSPPVIPTSGSTPSTPSVPGPPAGGQGRSGNTTPLNTPGHDGAAPGQGGSSPPGLSGATPGQSDTAGNASRGPQDPGSNGKGNGH